MIKYFVAGYYGMQNTGDDALQAVSCWGVKNFLQANKIWSTSSSILEFPGSELVQPIYASKPLMRGENRLRGYLKALRCDGVVFGGGSVFHSSPYLRMARDFIKLAGNGPHAAVGISIGPFRNVKAEIDCAKLLKNFHFIGLRDQESTEIARDLAPNVQSELTFDLAPLLQLAAGRETAHCNPHGSRRGIGFALCDYERFVGGDVTRDAVRRKRLLCLVEQLAADTDEEIVFIDFNGHYFYGDQQLHNELKHNFRGRATIRHICYTPNPLQVLHEISRLRVIVTMRLHASIFGYMSTTPTVMLSYHPKCIGWANQIGMDPALIFDSIDFDIKAVVNFIHKAMSGEVISPSLPQNIAIKNSMKNWTWIGKF